MIVNLEALVLHLLCITPKFHHQDFIPPLAFQLEDGAHWVGFFIYKRIVEKRLRTEDDKISIGVGLGNHFGINFVLNIFDTVIPPHIIFLR
jgi:hypothetical protein